METETHKVTIDKGRIGVRVEVESAGLTAAWLIEWHNPIETLLNIAERCPDLLAIIETSGLFA